MGPFAAGEAAMSKHAGKKSPLRFANLLEGDRQAQECFANHSNHLSCCGLPIITDTTRERAVGGIVRRCRAVIVTRIDLVVLPLYRTLIASITGMQQLVAVQARCMTTCREYEHGKEKHT